MIIIFGVKDKNEDFPSAIEGVCGNCNNTVLFRKVKTTSWITLFFIKMIPFRKRYFLMCPICNRAVVITKEEFENLEIYKENENKYHGKTETQIAFLKQKEEMEKSDKKET